MDEKQYEEIVDKGLDEVWDAIKNAFGQQYTLNHTYTDVAEVVRKLARRLYEEYENNKKSQ